jgi:hypothetical protein
MTIANPLFIRQRPAKNSHYLAKPFPYHRAGRNCRDDLDNDMWFGMGASVGKFKEKSCQIIGAVIYLTLLFTPIANDLFPKGHGWREALRFPALPPSVQSIASLSPTP